MKQCIEQKYHNDTQAAAVVPTQATAIITSVIGGIAQNVSATGRVGTRAFVWNIDIRGAFVLPAGTAESGGDIIRCMVVQDKQSNGATPSIAEVLDVTGTEPIYAFRNLENTRRYNILMDKTVSLEYDAAGGNGTAIETVQIRKLFSFSKHFESGLKVVYDTLDATGADNKIMDNNVWVMVFSRRGAPTVEWESRVRYTD